MKTQRDDSGFSVSNYNDSAAATIVLHEKGSALAILFVKRWCIALAQWFFGLKPVYGLYAITKFIYKVRFVYNHVVTSSLFFFDIQFFSSQL